MKTHNIVESLVSRFQQRTPMRTTSLIITLFGDVISQHGGSIWLGSLISILELFGVNERLVRTSVYRLSQDEWLDSIRVGRRSFYCFSEYGEHEYRRAALRIYALEDVSWHGQWQLLIAPDLPNISRDGFRKSLTWQGFRSINGAVWIKPGNSSSALEEILTEFDLKENVMIFDSTTPSFVSKSLLQEVVKSYWKLDEIAEAYTTFIKQYKPLNKSMSSDKSIDPQLAFIARLLMIHDYRRILLQDTNPPAELLPLHWPGFEARQLAGKLYQQLASPSIEFVRENLENESGPIPAANRSFFKRFESVN